MERRFEAYIETGRNDIDCTLSDNNYLKELKIKNHEFDIEFDSKNTGIYVTNTDEFATSAFITAVPELEDAEVTIIYGTNEVKKQNTSFTINPGNNYVYVRVKAPNGDLRTYTVNVFRSPSTNNKLKNIIISDGELEPEFDSETLNYTVYFRDELTFLDKISVMGIREDNKATLRGNGDYAIQTGNNEIVLTVTSLSGDTREYKINVVKVLDSSNKLSSLEVYEGELTPDFTKDGTNYYVTVPNEVTSLKLIRDENVIPESSEAEIEITGNSDFKVGMNTVQIKVIPTKGSIRTYTIYVTRSILASNFLKELYIEGYDFEPLFERSTLYYEVNVASSVTQVTLKALLEDETSKIEIDGEESIFEKTMNLSYGENKVYVKVTSNTGAERVYTVNVIRAQSSDYYLLTLTTDKGTWDKEFDTNVKEYSISAGIEDEVIKFSGTYSKGAYASGLGDVNVPVGESTHTIIITSESGQTNTYTFTINRVGNNETGIESITSNRGDLTLEDNKYKITVPDSASSIKFTVTTLDPNATVNMEEIYRLDYGTNEIEIEVVAQDKETKKKYIIEVKREKDLASINIIEDTIALDIGEEFDILYELDPYGVS